MKKCIPLFFLPCLSFLSAQAQPAEPAEYLAIGYPGQIINLADTDHIEIIVEDGDTRQLVFAKTLRTKKVDSITEVLDLLNNTEIQFGTPEPLRVIDFRLGVYGKDHLSLFYAQKDLIVSRDFTAAAGPEDVQHYLKEPADLDLFPSRFPLRLKKIQNAYHLSGRNWEYAYEAQATKKHMLALPPSFFISAFAIEQDEQTFVYDLASGELKIVYDRRLNPDIQGNSYFIRDPYEDYSSIGPYTYTLSDLNFQFKDFKLYTSTEDGVDFTYEPDDLPYGPPIFTFAENTGSVRIRVRETRWGNRHDYVWYTTLERLRQNKGFEVVPYVNQEGGMELPAPAGETVFYWVQPYRKMLPPIPPPSFP